MSNTIFFTEWESDLGINRIEFFASGSELLINPEYIELLPEVVIVEKYNAEFDKLPIGMIKTPVLELTVNTSWAQEYTKEFRKLFTNSVFEMEMTADTTLQLGTIVKYSPAGQSNWFTGMIRDDQEIDIDPDQGQVQVKCEHIVRALLDQVAMSEIGKYFIAGYYITEGFFAGDVTEFRSTYNGERLWQMVTRDQDYIMAFFKLYKIMEYINVRYSDYYSIAMRTNLSSIYIQHPCAKHYKQNPMNPALYGEALEYYDDIYVLGVIIKNDGNGTVIGGLFKDYKDGIGKYNSAWDYISEVTEQYLMKTSIVFNRTITSPIFSYSEVKKIDWDRVLSKPKVKLNAKRLKTVTSSLSETKSDDGWSDQNKYEAKTASSRNGNEWTIPIVYNNAPVCVKYTKYKGSWYQWRSFHPHIWGLYYKQLKEGSTTEYEMFKCHNYVELYLTWLKTSGTLPNSEFKAHTLWHDFIVDDPSGLATYIQQNGGAAQYAAESLRTLFGFNGQTELEIELKSDENDFSIELHNTIFEINASELMTDFELPGNKWLLTSFTYSPVEEKTTLKLILGYNDAF